MSLDVLSHGVDSLYLSFAGKLEPELLEAMEQLKAEAQKESLPAPISFSDGRATLVMPYGRHFYAFWVHCSDFDCFLARGEHVPPVSVQLRSEYLHAAGPRAAAAEAEAFVSECLMASAKPAVVSRIDLYADFQGWLPLPEDLGRLVTRSVSKQLYFEPAQEHHQGHRLSGFRFGKDQLVARLYDKTLEITSSGKDWMAEVWGPDRRPEEPVWRLEYQYRRGAIAGFNLSGVKEVLDQLPDLWRYGLGWLSLREPAWARQRDHWPLAEEWRQLAELSFQSQLGGLVRRRYREHREEVLVRLLAGCLTSLAAIHQELDFERAGRLALGLAGAHLAERPETFAHLVAKKRLQLV